MWPEGLYTSSDPAGRESLEYLVYGGGLDAYQSFDPIIRVGLQFAGTLVVALVVLGMIQGYGPRIVAKSRRSPVISFCIGLPAVLVLGGLASTGYLIVGTSLGTFFGVPLVILGSTVLPTATALGFVAIGQTIGARLGQNQLAVGILVGSLVGGLAAFSLPATVAVTALAASLGVGAGARVLFNAGSSSSPDERTVPPANKI
ncbi:hypothetical protein [Halopiger djelfimassiliensis]|uniref:hypothetical protein n=1 Tax=Halopiger djelfimassiliensis TaxID=1293047 RepID=UPI0009DBDFBB|nr:hypothetical protein [Halopiger djelfimassiliensis]